MKEQTLRVDQPRNESHANRIKRELVEAGLTRYGGLKFSAHYLRQIIHPYEHIRGIAYGRHGPSERLFGRMNEGMLIATDRRVIFLDHKPGYTDLKEFTYDVVSGIECLTAGPSSSVTLYTRIGDYTIRFANPRCVKQFMDYVELRHIESDSRNTPPPSTVTR
jgi:hypothetical protein